MTPTSLHCHILQAVKSMSETRGWWQRGSEMGERKRQRGRRRRRGVMLSVHGGKDQSAKICEWITGLIPVFVSFIIIRGVKLFKSLFFCLFYCQSFLLSFFLTCVLLWSPGLHLLLSLPLSPSWSDHTPHVSEAYQTGETCSDLANKPSINGAVKRVTHASQNLLRSNSPLQLPLHWSDPWAASRRDWPEDSHSVMKSYTCEKKVACLPVIRAHYSTILLEKIW